MTELSYRVSQPKWFTWGLIRPLFSVFLLAAAFLKLRDFGTPNALFDIVTA